MDQGIGGIVVSKSASKSPTRRYRWIASTIVVAGLLLSATATPGAPRREGVESGSSTISFERRVALLQRHFGLFFARLAVIALPISQAAPDDLDPTFSGDGGLVSTAYARYNAGARLDTYFGIAGRVTTSFGGTIDAAFAVKLQPNGKTVAARKDGGINTGLALPRYNTKGSAGAASEPRQSHNADRTEHIT